MKTTLAKTAGFCFGVDRAVSLVEQAVCLGKQVVTLGPIIHNKHVVNRFAEQGVHEIQLPEQVPDGSCVVIRSHGISKAVYEELQARSVEILDATCPFVKRIHKLVSAADEKGRQTMIIGTRTHPEVQAIAGWCSHPRVFETPEALECWLMEEPERKNLPITLVR